jgi:catechol 2,3-dioxygenase-like lactoylglutathione lyase family enzyme
MAIIATARYRRMQASISFYTEVLAFDCVEPGGNTDPTVSVLMRGGSLLCISSHGGDGTFGQAVMVLTDDVDELFRKFRWEHSPLRARLRLEPVTEVGGRR